MIILDNDSTLSTFPSLPPSLLPSAVVSLRSMNCPPARPDRLIVKPTGGLIGAGRGYYGRGRRFQRGFPACLEGDGGCSGGAAVGMCPRHDRGDESWGELDALSRGGHPTEPSTVNNDVRCDRAVAHFGPNIFGGRGQSTEELLATIPNTVTLAVLFFNFICFLNIPRPWGCSPFWGPCTATKRLISGFFV